MRKFRWLAAASLAGGLVVLGCAKQQAAEQPVKAMDSSSKLEKASSDRVARGKYLVTMMACSDCHTPFKMTPQGPAPDEARFLSGHPENFEIKALPKADPVWIWAGTGTNTAFAGPWGVSFAANLTPHKISGLGGVWDEARFLRAMRTGKHMGESRPILPPMPWQGLSQASDEDLKAIWAFLQTIPAIHNEVPSAIPPRGAGSLQ